MEKGINELDSDKIINCFAPQIQENFEYLDSNLGGFFGTESVSKIVLDYIESCIGINGNMIDLEVINSIEQPDGTRIVEIQVTDMTGSNNKFTKQLTFEKHNLEWKIKI